MQLVMTAKRILEKLESSGFEAYMVGGCVRDMLLNRPLHDIDICTSARPEEVISLFERTVPTGLKHGTVTVVEDDVPFEVTTFRTEEGYSDYRRPDRVQFVDSLKQDLSRRDFTINAMALDRFDRLYDYFGGRRDLERQVIRTVGEPRERFAEDALRMFRAIRFSGQLGFSVGEKVLSAIRIHRRLLEKVARERITHEFQKLLQAPYVEQGLRLLWSSGITRDVSPFHYLHKGLREILSFSIQALTERERWVLLLYHMDEQYRASFLHALRLPKAFVKEIKRLLRHLEHYEHVIDVEDIPAYDLIRLGEEDFVSLLKLNQLMLNRSVATDLRQQIRTVLDNLPIRHPQELCVNGKDLQLFRKRSPGPWIQEELDRLVKAVVEGKVPNEREAIRAFVMEDEKHE